MLSPAPGWEALSGENQLSPENLVTVIGEVLGLLGVKGGRRSGAALRPTAAASARCWARHSRSPASVKIIQPRSNSLSMGEGKVRVSTMPCF